MTTALLDRIAERHREREQTRARGYHALVAAIADGAEPDADDVEAVLADSNKTVEQLRESVALLQLRRRLADEVAEAEAMRAEEPGIARGIAKARADLEAAQARYHAAVAPLRHRAEEINAAVTRTVGHAAELANGCPYPDRVAAFRDAEAARQDAALRRDRLRAEVERGRAALTQLEAEFARRQAGTDKRTGFKLLQTISPVEAATWQRDMAGLDESIQRRKARIAEQEAALVGLCREADRLAAVAEAARRELLIP